MKQRNYIADRYITQMNLYDLLLTLQIFFGLTIEAKLSKTAIERYCFKPIEDIYYVYLDSGINGNAIFLTSSSGFFCLNATSHNS